MSRKKLLSLLLIATLLIPLSGCILETGDTVSIGSRNNTESIILSHVIGRLVEEETDLNVIYRENLGGSNVVWNALMNDSIQIIPDYTGTIVLSYYHDEVGDADETLARAKELMAQDGLVGLEPFGFNNTYTLALDESIAEENDIHTFSDFAEYSDEFVLGAVFEFIDRPDGLPGFEKEYDLDFKDVKGMDHGMMYRAFDNKDVDVINSYTTDGQLQIYDLRVLEDDKSYFPPYHALPVLRENILEEHPELEDILLKLEGKIDEETIQEMNGKVDNDAMMVEKVAEDFLIEADLISE